MAKIKVSIVGTAGIPANYGGFETLAENLARFAEESGAPADLDVYCSAKNHEVHQAQYHGANLIYLPISANGIESIPYDIWSLLLALRNADVVLLLGVSGAVALPVLKLFSRAKIVTNIDGIEWRRDKWPWLARKFLRFSERCAVHYSDIVIADNEAIANYVSAAYGKSCAVIAYGGDHAVSVAACARDDISLPDDFALALCRIEPENNVHMILEAFDDPSMPALVYVGNWDNSEYGRRLKERYAGKSNLQLLDPIYDLGNLRWLRDRASMYVHGHSAGGTNPSLVEMMHFGLPVLAFDCEFNRFSTDGKALYFSGAEDLRQVVASMEESVGGRVAADMKRIAQERYTWNAVGSAYFDVLMGDGVKLGVAGNE